MNRPFDAKEPPVQAWQVHELGEPKDVLTLDEVETPRAAGGEIVVRHRGKERAVLLV